MSAWQYMNIQYDSVSIMLCQLNPHCLWPQAFRHIMLWYLVLTHTPYLTTFTFPLWLQNRETSLFTRYERGSLTIWGLMKFPWIRNASACQTFGWKSFEIWSVWADKPVCFCRLPLITSNITHKTLKWSFTPCFLWLLVNHWYSKMLLKRVLSE